MAKDPPQPGRIIRLRPGQRQIDRRVLETAPTPEEIAARRARVGGSKPAGNPTGSKALAPTPVPTPAPSGSTVGSSTSAAALTRLKKFEQHLLKRYPMLAGEITPENLNAHLRALTSNGSRVVGYPGERAAADYVSREFKRILGSVEEERFNVTTPVDAGGELTLPNGKKFPLRALWPNLVRTSQMPEGGLNAPVIWARSGKLPDFNGRDIAAPEAKVSRRRAEDLATAQRAGIKVRSASLGTLDLPGEPARLLWRVGVGGAESIEGVAGGEWQATLIDAMTGAVVRPLGPAAETPQVHRNTGAIVVVEFNTASDWLNAPRLGAEAVIFVEPDDTVRGEAESKFLSIPVAIPRFWISKADAARLIPELQRKDPPRAVVTCDMKWKRVEARNFVGKIEGWDPLDSSDGGARLADVLKLPADGATRLEPILREFDRAGRTPAARAAAIRAVYGQLDPAGRRRWKDALATPSQIIVLHAFYDAMSCVPSLAPGAENAVSMAGLLELARLYRKHPPRRTVWLVATSGHFFGLQGIKAYLDRHIDSFSPPGLIEQAAAGLTRSAGFLFAVPQPLRALFPVLVSLLVVWRLMVAFRKRRAGPALQAALLLLGVAVLSLTTRPTVLRERPQIYLFAGLDLSSNSKGVGIFYKGYFYDYREDIQNRFADIARVTRENSEKVALVFGQDPKAIFADGVNPIEGKNWRNFIPGKMALDAEVWSLTGARGVAFATVDDARPYVDTPYDTLDRINLDNVATQTKTLACLIDHILNDTNSAGELDTLRMPILEASNFQRMGLQGGFASVEGRVVQFDLRESFIPSTPVPGSLAVITSPNKTLMGVRGPLVQETEPDGHYSFYGIPPLTAFQQKSTTQVHAYHISEKTGDIDYAPDLGHTGAKAYPVEVEVTMASKSVQVIVFNCESTSIYDFIDPQSLRTLSDVHVYDGATNAEPRMYGMAISHPERYQAVVEDAAVFFAQPGFAIKVVMGAGPAAIRFVLINSTYRRDRKYSSRPGELPDGNTGLVRQSGIQGNAIDEGIGYKLGEQRVGGDTPAEITGVSHDRTYERTIPSIAYRVALDMWNWDDANAEKLRKYRIINQQLDDLHNRAGRYLNLAEEAMARKDHARAYAYSRMAYGYEARAYPEVQSTARDVVKGVMFYLALLLPFAFFLERLLIASPDLKRQITWVFGIFIVAFIVMSRIHPAFDITMSPMIVLLAFIMLALSVLVIMLIAGKFEQQLKDLNKQLSGSHSADIGRGSIAAAAFALGISNMRRRWMRSLLTCITLVLLTFIVLSFTSVVSGIRYNIVPAPGEPRYNGVMLRTPLWDPLEESSYRLLNDEFGAVHPVAPRAWFYGAQQGEQTFLTLTRGDKKFDARAVLGLSPEEARITQVQQALLAGRWFRTSDTYSAILTRDTGEKLGVTEASVSAGTARVRYAGSDYSIVGLLDNDAFKTIKDLDQEPLTPVDFILMQRQGAGSGGGGGDGGFQEYTHLEPDTCLILPFETLMRQGGDVRSVGINLTTPQQVTETRLDLMPRLGLNLYAGEGGKTYRYSAIGGTSIAGPGSLFFPILIASLIILSTMLGAVYERQKEIHIFSSIGLAPNHVAMLFMAEALVYAVLGAMAGYMVGQGAAKVIVALNVLQGLNLNFSSVAAVMSTTVVMAVVLLSALYPAKKAGEVATPALERTWRTPEPVGDRWEIPLPFMVTGDQAQGLNSFLGEWFSAYEEYSVGDFVTQGVSTTEGRSERGSVYSIHLTCWLAPFDLGVSQQVEVQTTPTEMEDVFEIRLILHRLSGDISNWRRVNRRFLNTLRKQFLIWRTLRTEERERYVGGPVAAD